MQQILVYGDSLSWGIVPGTRQRLEFARRWPGVMEIALRAAGHDVRVIEDCLNGRRTVWDDPFKPGRNGLQGLAQRIEIHSPLALVILVLGTNDFQCMHDNSPFLSAQGLAALINTIRQAPLEPGMAAPPILIVAPPAIVQPKGPIAAKFEGANLKSAGLAAAYAELAQQLDCAFFDANGVTPASTVDGIHLDVDQHMRLGQALADWFGPWSIRTKSHA
ncbi:MAG TPA: SGNH/GDSL hydrolase family protein [Methylophilaceae bacterium]|nr:SGNH/GDSL hydrolase family protein [Methylophilaceae bacterium]